MPGMELWTVIANAVECNLDAPRPSLLQNRPTVALGGFASDFEHFRSQWPRVLHESPIRGLDLKQETDSQGPRGSYVITTATGFVLGLPFGGTVALIHVAFQADHELGAVQLMRDLSFRKAAARLDGEPISTWVSARTDEGHHAFEPGRVHQLIVIPIDTLRRKRIAYWRKVPTDLPLDANFDIVGRLIHKEAGAYRAELSRSRLHLPPEGNYFTSQFLGVTSHTTIVAGHEPRLVNAFVLNTSLAIGSAVAAMSIREAAITAASTFDRRRDEAIDLGSLGALARKVRRLELATSHVVSAYGDSAFVTGSERIAAHRRALGDALDLARGATVLRTLLHNLSEAVATTLAEHDAARRSEEARHRDDDDRRRNAQEDRVRRLTWITSSVAAVAVPLTLITGFFGMNTKPVETGTSIFDGRYAMWGGVLIAVLALAVLIGVLGSRRTKPGRGAGSQM